MTWYPSCGPLIKRSRVSPVPRIYTCAASLLLQLLLVFPQVTYPAPPLTIIEHFVYFDRNSDSIDPSTWTVTKAGLNVPIIIQSRGRAKISTGKAAGNSVAIQSRKRLSHFQYKRLVCEFRMRVSHATGRFEWEVGIQDPASLQDARIWMDPDINLIMFLTGNRARTQGTAIKVNPTIDHVYSIELARDGSKTIAKVDGSVRATHVHDVPFNMHGHAKLGIGTSENINRFIDIDYLVCFGKNT